MQAKVMVLEWWWGQWGMSGEEQLAQGAPPGDPRGPALHGLCVSLCQLQLAPGPPPPAPQPQMPTSWPGWGKITVSSWTHPGATAVCKMVLFGCLSM